ncbi:MAG: hypothetical protein K2P70_03720 [Hyphomonadaceae bacterium]|nr:hypothetical protein [Hyphomonadaceae bacterium]
MTQTATRDHPVVGVYMKTFEDALRAFDCDHSSEIARDLRGHIAEAQAMGKPVDEVLASIGPAEKLARAYAVELELNPRGEKLKRNIGGILRVTGILAAASFLTFIVVMLLGTIAVGFVPTGLAVIVFSGVELSGYDVPFLQLGPLLPIGGMAAGAIVTLLGLLAGWGLKNYLRALANTLRRALPVPPAKG